MDVERIFLFILVGVGIYFASGTVYFFGSFAQDAANETTNANISLPTGGEGIPVITANGTQVAEAAPAESIVDLFNYILVVAVPAVVALGGMIFNFIRMTGLGKKYAKEIGYMEDGFKYIDTMAPKVKQQVIDSGLAKTSTEIILNKLDTIKPGLKAEVEQEIQTRTPELKQRFEEALQQIEELKKRVPPEWYADKDKAIPRISDGTVKKVAT
jgi:hypothetical protein